MIDYRFQGRLTRYWPMAAVGALLWLLAAAGIVALIGAL